MIRKLITIIICIILLSSAFGLLLENRSFGESEVDQANISGKSIRSRSTIIVDCNGTGDYTKIQDAIDNASAGDIIRVYMGKYNETIIIDKKLDIIGNSSNSTVIDAEQKSDAIAVNSNDCSITGFYITGAGFSSSGYRKSGIRINNDSIKVSNCDIFRNHYGVKIENRKNITIENTLISGSYLFALELRNLKNILIDRCKLNFNNDGMHLRDSDIFQMVNSECNSNKYGMKIHYSINGTIENNMFYKNSYNSIYIQDSSNFEIFNNNFTINGSAGVNLESGSNNNLIYQNNFNGQISKNFTCKMGNDGGSKNRWDNGIVGNHWCNWTSPDKNKDGIVDKPYYLSGSPIAKDNFPLVKPTYQMNLFLKIKTQDIKWVFANEYYSVKYLAIDVNTPQNQLIWTMNTNATWLKFSQNKELSGTPLESDIGTYWVNISVTDGVNIDTRNFTLNVLKWSTNVLIVGSGQKYNRIQDAIDNASAGDMIRVWAGEYSEHVIVNKKLNFIGNGTTYPNRAHINYKSIGGNGITINTDHCNVSGFYITSWGKMALSSGIHISSEHNNIDNCTFYDDSCGITVTQDNNTILNCNNSWNSRGINLVRAKNTKILNCTSEGNIQGINISFCEKVLVKDLKSRNNKYSNTYGDGISLFNTKDSVIIASEFDQDRVGMEIGYESSGNYILNNTILNSENEGIFIDRYSFNNSIVNNTFDYNYGGEIRIEGYNNSIFHNNFMDTYYWNQIFDEGKNIWNNEYFEGNYWSDYNGIDQDSDGIGDTKLPWKGVDYYPLMEPTQNYSSSIERKNIIKNLKFKLDLKEDYNLSDNNLNGTLFIENNNQINLFTIDPSIYEKNISNSPNILFEVIDQNSSQKYYSWDTQILKIQAKSNGTINFSLSGFDTSKEWSSEQFKLPIGNYSIEATLSIFVDSNFYFNITSKMKYFGIINQTSGQNYNVIPTFENLSIFINLSKQKYLFGEPITGTFNISNKNSADFKLDNSKFQYLWGYEFGFQSFDKPINYSSPRYNIFLDRLQINANKSVSQGFKILPSKVYKLPNNSEGDNYTTLDVGNYSIHGHFFFGGSSVYKSIESNNVTFQICENRSILEIKDNIYIKLVLNKSEYEFHETINGTIIITNNNSFDININDPFYQKLFGVFFGIYSLDFKNYSSIFDRHYEAKIDHLRKYYIKAKSNIEIEFKLEKYVRVDFQAEIRSTPEGIFTYYNSTNIPSGKYYIAAYIHELARPDYELEVFDKCKILSNIVNFSIIEKIPEEIYNISIELLLSKSEYMINESINGTINILNKNPFQIELETDYLLQRLNGEHFEIRSIETSSVYKAILNNFKYPIKVNASSLTKISFKFTHVVKLPIKIKNITYTKLTPGNYSIFAYFNYGHPFNYTQIMSNNVTFEIIGNGSSSISGPDPLSPPTYGNDNGGRSAGSFFFYYSIGIGVIVFLMTAAFITGTEVGKFGFFSAIAPLYTKRRRKKDENYGYNRGLIQGYIDGNPGESYNSIKRALDLKNGTLAYYLRILEKERKIKIERDGMYKRFYPTVGKPTSIKVELSKLQEKIFKFITQNPGTSQTNISKELDILNSKLNYHINLMTDARLIKVERDGNKTKCYVLSENN